LGNNKNNANNWIWIFFVSIFIILIALVLFYFYNKYEITPIYKFEREDKPIVQIENFSDSLKKLGKLAEKDNDKSFAIFVNEVKSEASHRGKLPHIIRTIISSAFINTSSKKVIVKASYNIKNLPLYPSDIYIINGAITEFIQTKKLIYIKLNLNPWNARTSNYISGMNTEVSMSFYETKNGNKGFTIKSQAYNISGNSLENYDIHSMITIISRLAVIELIGKLRNYPYWNCIEGSKVDFELLNKKADLELSNLNKQRISVPK
jgi:hypothetical protein